MLDTKLTGSAHSLVSTILPRPGHPLPEEIKTAISISEIKKHHQSAQINIAIEINHWINKEEALVHLEHTRNLLQAFFHEQKLPTATYELSIFENETKIEPQS